MLANPSDQHISFAVSWRTGSRCGKPRKRQRRTGDQEGARAEGRGVPAREKRPEGIRALEERLIEKLGTKVEVRGSSSKGKIQISYFSADDLERILQILQ